MNVNACSWFCVHDDLSGRERIMGCLLVEAVLQTMYIVYDTSGLFSKCGVRSKRLHREKVPVVRGKGEHIRAVDGTPTIAHVQMNSMTAPTTRIRLRRKSAPPQATVDK